MADDPYYQILTELARARVEFVLGGGLACVLQGAERVTMDVDIAVLMSPPNFQGFLAVMDRLGLKPRVPVPPQQLLDLAVVEVSRHRKTGAGVYLRRSGPTDSSS